MFDLIKCLYFITGFSADRLLFLSAGMPLFQRASVFNPNKVTATHAGSISKNWIS